MTLHHRFSTDNVEIIVLSDGQSAFPSEFLMIGVDESQRLAACNRWGFDPDAVPSNINAVYINLNNEKILFDTGAGASLPGCGTLPAALNEAGVNPGEIELVIHTHLHLDHVGWNTTADGAPMFPNSRYIVGETELAFWSSEDTLSALEKSELWNLPQFEPAMASSVRAQVLSLGDQVDTCSDSGTVTDGVRAIPAFGHTPGHLAFEVDLGDHRLIVAGDLALSPFHVEQSTWYPGVDLDPEQSMVSRKLVLGYVADTGAMMVGYHLPFPGLGRLARTEEGFEWTPLDGVQR